MAAFVAIRVLHVVLAALWLGAGVFTALFLFPTLGDSAPGSNSMFAALMRRRFGVYMAVTGGLAVLTGIWLYWRFTGGFSAATIGTTSGIVFGIGGLAGIAAVAIGGAVIGRSADKMAALIEQAAPQSEIEALRQRALGANRVVAALMILAVVCMAAGHYV
ncbi:MAG TPA: hypothetical protein VFB36_00980 [Nevskiaceae bacterium]|nr:hypothetical protein [Nevskiaceae bacterium]